MNLHSWRRRSIVCCAAFFLLASSVVRADIDEWLFEGWAGTPVPISQFNPDCGTTTSPIVIVMHGASRDAPRYFRDWRRLAVEHCFIVVVPEFSKKDFEGSARYNLGHVFEPQTSTRRDEALWTFSVIEPLFDAVVENIGGKQTGYILYGHSAGSQFVHRFLYYKPDARVSKYIAANAGWYTLPVYDANYPYGLAGSGIEEKSVAGIFVKPLTILLGGEDNDPNGKSLRRTPEALAQGPHRLARGQTMYHVAKSHAAVLGVPFNWTLQFIECADHNNAKMASPAADLISQ